MTRLSATEGRPQGGVAPQLRWGEKARQENQEPVAPGPQVKATLHLAPPTTILPTGVSATRTPPRDHLADEGWPACTTGRKLKGWPDQYFGPMSGRSIGSCGRVNVHGCRLPTAEEPTQRAS